MTSTFALFLCPVSGDVLLVQQRGGKWALPGGHREKWETGRQALSRECREEISFDPTGLNPLNQFTLARAKGPALVTSYLHRPRVRVRNEITDARWFALNALPKHISCTAQAALVALEKTAIAA